MVVIVVKQYAVREAEKWRFAVCKAKIGRYAQYARGEGVSPSYSLSDKHIDIIHKIHNYLFT